MLLRYGRVVEVFADPSYVEVILAGGGNETMVATCAHPQLEQVLDLARFPDGSGPLMVLYLFVTNPSDPDIPGLQVEAAEPALPSHWARPLAQVGIVEDGWLEGTLAAPSLAAIQRTEEFLALAVVDQCPRPGMYASMDGGVQLSWRPREVTIEVNILNNGQATAHAFSMSAAADAELITTATDARGLLDFVTEHLE